MERGKRHRLAPGTLAHARQLRGPLTPAEKRLWWHLRAGQLAGFKFRRQYVVGHFIADFYCPRARLVVEIDGDTHAGCETRDAVRTDALSEKGYQVIRFTNQDVHQRLPLVVETILSECKRPGLPSP